jgi:hypothetical protein
MRRLLGAFLVVLVTGACLGPKPEVGSATVAAPTDGKAEVTVVLINSGSGDGQVELKITLRQGDQVVGRAQQAVELKSKETITIVTRISVPSGARDLTVQAEVAYPPD